MTKHPEIENATLESNLLTQQEQAICEHVASLEAPHNQRATALLALNGHSIQAQAAEQAGLTVGQVKYWAAKFRKQRLGIFPDSLLEELKPEADDKKVESKTEKEEKPVAVAESAESSTDKIKSAKTKKVNKGKKKTAKAEKGKKDKKKKKSKKKPKKDKKSSKPKKIKKKSKRAKTNKKGKKSKKSKK